MYSKTEEEFLMKAAKHLCEEGGSPDDWVGRFEEIKDSPEESKGMKMSKAELCRLFEKPDPVKKPKRIKPEVKRNPEEMDRRRKLLDLALSCISTMGAPKPGNIAGGVMLRACQSYEKWAVGLDSMARSIAAQVVNKIKKEKVK